MVYKCEIKVCKKDDEATCSTTNKDGQANTCVARTYYNLGRKRRQTDDDETQIPEGTYELSKEFFIIEFSFDIFLNLKLVLKILQRQFLSQL